MTLSKTSPPPGRRPRAPYIALPYGAPWACCCATPYSLTDTEEKKERESIVVLQFFGDGCCDGYCWTGDTYKNNRRTTTRSSPPTSRSHPHHRSHQRGQEYKFVKVSPAAIRNPPVCQQVFHAVVATDGRRRTRRQQRQQLKYFEVQTNDRASGLYFRVRSGKTA